MPETIKRIKKDVADKGIMFFDEIDQSKPRGGCRGHIAPVNVPSGGLPNTNKASGVIDSFTSTKARSRSSSASTKRR
jgi:hypothetical protein